MAQQARNRHHTDDTAPGTHTASSQALRAEAHRASAAESAASSLRSLNAALQAEAQNASGELLELRRRERELEEALAGARRSAAAAEARLRELELLDDHGGIHTPPGEAAEGRSHFDAGALAAVAAALGVPAHPHGDGASAAQHGSGHPPLHPHLHAEGGSRRASGTGGEGGEHARHVHMRVMDVSRGFGGPCKWGLTSREPIAATSLSPTAYHAPGHFCLPPPDLPSLPCPRAQLPADIRRHVAKLLRRRDLEAAKLRADKAELEQQLAQAKRLAAAAAAAPAAPVATPAGRSVVDGMDISPTRHTPAAAAGVAAGVAAARASGGRRASADSWVSDDEFDWGSGPVEEAYQVATHGHAQTHSSLQQRPNHRQQHPGAGADTSSTSSSGQDAGAQLAAANEALARLRQELEQARARAEQQAKELAAATAARGAAEARLTEVEARAAVAEVEHGAAAQDANAALAEAHQQLEELRTAHGDLQRSAGQDASASVAAATAAEARVARLESEREVMQQQLAEALRAAARADAAAAGAVEAAGSSSSRLSEENSKLRGELAEVQLRLAEAKAEATAAREAAATAAKTVAEAEARERKAAEVAAKDVETSRQRLLKLQKDMNDLRAETAVRQGVGAGRGGGAWG